MLFIKNPGTFCVVLQLYPPGSLHGDFLYVDSSWVLIRRQDLHISARILKYHCLLTFAWDLKESNCRNNFSPSNSHKDALVLKNVMRHLLLSLTRVLSVSFQTDKLLREVLDNATSLLFELMCAVHQVRFENH